MRKHTLPGTVQFFWCCPQVQPKLHWLILFSWSHAWHYFLISSGWTWWGEGKDLARKMGFFKDFQFQLKAESPTSGAGKMGQPGLWIWMSKRRMHFQICPCRCPAVLHHLSTSALFPLCHCLLTLYLISWALWVGTMPKKMMNIWWICWTQLNSKSSWTTWMMPLSMHCSGPRALCEDALPCWRSLYSSTSSTLLWLHIQIRSLRWRL